MDGVLNQSLCIDCRRYAMKQLEIGVEQISEVIQNNSAAAQETSATSQELSAQSESLEHLVGFFFAAKYLLAGSFLPKLPIHV